MATRATVCEPIREEETPDFTPAACITTMLQENLFCVPKGRIYPWPADYVMATVSSNVVEPGERGRVDTTVNTPGCLVVFITPSLRGVRV